MSESLLGAGVISITRAPDLWETTAASPGPRLQAQSKRRTSRVLAHATSLRGRPRRNPSPTTRRRRSAALPVAVHDQRVGGKPAIAFECTASYRSANSHAKRTKQRAAAMSIMARNCFKSRPLRVRPHTLIFRGRAPPPCPTPPPPTPRLLSRRSTPHRRGMSNGFDPIRRVGSSSTR